jgi:Holliday junction resolvase RusA-like endonuclease
LPGANDIIRKHYMVYSKLKAQWGLTIARCIIVAKLKRVQRCRVVLRWQEPNNRRDDDNVIFGQKFVLDALRDTKIIPDDRRKFVESVTNLVTVVPTCPGVHVTIEEVYI